MKQNDFYEVDGCTEFVPVTISEVYDDGVIVTVNNAKRNCMLAVEEVYLFPKVHEPQKPVIPKFVVDWIEDNKGYVSKWDEEARADFVFMAINDLFRLGEGIKPLDFTIDEKVSEWMTENTYKFITAILFDYTVEKEKLYTVEIKGITHGRLFKNIHTNTYLLHSGDGLECYTDKLTEIEIRQANEYLWQFAKEVK